MVRNEYKNKARFYTLAKTLQQHRNGWRANRVIWIQKKKRKKNQWVPMN